jgi:hypothetical protein
MTKSASHDLDRRTIEKTYDELSGVLANRVSVLDVMLASLQLQRRRAWIASA